MKHVRNVSLLVFLAVVAVGAFDPDPQECENEGLRAGAQCRDYYPESDAFCVFCGQEQCAVFAQSLTSDCFQSCMAIIYPACGQGG
jgi:hypothetical protein